MLISTHVLRHPTTDLSLSSFGTKQVAYAAHLLYNGATAVVCCCSVLLKKKPRRPVGEVVGPSLMLNLCTSQKSMMHSPALLSTFRAQRTRWLRVAAGRSQPPARPRRPSNLPTPPTFFFLCYPWKYVMVCCLLSAVLEANDLAQRSEQDVQRARPWLLVCHHP